MLNIHIIGGAIAIILGLWGLFAWWPEFGLVLRGLFPFAIIIFGLLLIASKFQNQGNSRKES